MLQRQRITAHILALAQDGEAAPFPRDRGNLSLEVAYSNEGEQNSRRSTQGEKSAQHLAQDQQFSIF